MLHIRSGRSVGRYGRFHYEAWAAIARELGFAFTAAQGEATKGVSRMASLEIVLRAGGLEKRFTTAEKEQLAARKNALYLQLVSGMTPADVLPGVRSFLEDVGRPRRQPGAGLGVEECGSDPGLLRPPEDVRGGGRRHDGHACETRPGGFPARCGARRRRRIVVRGLRGRGGGDRGRDAGRDAFGGRWRQPGAIGRDDAAAEFREFQL